jgi:MFS family permease
MVISRDSVSGRKGIFYGWWMALACAFMNFFIGGVFFYGFTVFFNPIRQTFNWTAAQTSIAFSFQRLESGLAGPIVGFLVDRTGPRKLMIGGWIIVGISFFWMSRINSLMEFYAAFFILAVGFSFGSFVVMNAAIANWFSKKRSRALTIIYLGFGLSGLLVPLLTSTVNHFGWRQTLVFVAVISLIIGLPLSLLMRHKPDQYGLFPDGEDLLPDRGTQPAPIQESTRSTGSPPIVNMTAIEAVKTRSFWLLSSVFFFQQIGTPAIIVHIVPYLTSIQISPTIAALSVAILTLCSLLGRLIFGLLGDFKDKRYLITITVALQTVGIFLFSLIEADKIWLLWIFLFIFGLGYGGPIPIRPALQADYFGTKSFGTILGLTSLVSMLPGLVSPVVAGWIFDTTGSYKTAWQIYSLITLPAVPLMLLAKSPKVK